MKIQILGTGCAKCEKLYEEVRKAVAEAGVDAEIEKVQDMKQIVAAGILMTPGLVIDGEVKVSGKVLKAKDIAKWLK